MQSYSRVFEYAQKGYLLDLSKEPVLAKVIDSAKPAVTWNGKQWALPMDFAGIGIIYNKDIFAQYNLKAPTTYRELERVVKTLKDNGVTPFAGLLKENWSIGHFITLVQTNLLAEKNIPVAKFIADMDAGKTSYGVVDTKKLFSIIDFYRANMDDNAEEMSWNEQQAAFAGGKSAMMVQGLWSYGAAIGTNPKPELRVRSLPRVQRREDEQVLRGRGFHLRDLLAGIRRQAGGGKEVPRLACHSPGREDLDHGLQAHLRLQGRRHVGPAAPLRAADVHRREERRLPLGLLHVPHGVFEDACKNGAQAYVFKKKAAEDVIADIDRMWREARKQ